MVVYLDNGHGGLILGKAQTAGRRSSVLANGKQVFEGEFNRGIVNGIIQELSFMQVPYYHVCPELEDRTLDTRIDRANRNFKRKSFYLSVHSNAGGGNGCEFWAYQGSSKGGKIAQIFAEEFEKEFPGERLRTEVPTRKYKESRTYRVLRKTRMPAIITENFFFDNNREARDLLLDRQARQRIVDFHVAAIVRTQVEVFGENPPLQG